MLTVSLSPPSWSCSHAVLMILRISPLRLLIAVNTARSARSWSGLVLFVFFGDFVEGFLVPLLVFLAVAGFQIHEFAVSLSGMRFIPSSLSPLVFTVKKIDDEIADGDRRRFELGFFLFVFGFDAKTPSLLLKSSLISCPCCSWP